jgi:hypothetical protein
VLASSCHLIPQIEDLQRNLALIHAYLKHRYQWRRTPIRLVPGY